MAEQPLNWQDTPQGKKMLKSLGELECPTCAGNGFLKRRQKAAPDAAWLDTIAAEFGLPVGLNTRLFAGLVWDCATHRALRDMPEEAFAAEALRRVNASMDPELRAALRNAGMRQPDGDGVQPTGGPKNG